MPHVGARDSGDLTLCLGEGLFARVSEHGVLNQVDAKGRAVLPEGFTLCADDDADVELHADGYHLMQGRRYWITHGGTSTELEPIAVYVIALSTGSSAALCSGDTFTIRPGVVGHFDVRETQCHIACEVDGSMLMPGVAGVHFSGQGKHTFRGYTLPKVFTRPVEIANGAHGILFLSCEPMGWLSVP